MKIFAYGTLKRGEERAFALKGQEFLGMARTVSRYRLLNIDGTYPGLVEDAGGISIEGEIWEVDDECLQLLDQIEAVDVGGYERSEILLSAPHSAEKVHGYIFLGSVVGLEDCGTSW